MWIRILARAACSKKIKESLQLVENDPLFEKLLVRVLSIAFEVIVLLRIHCYNDEDDC